MKILGIETSCDETSVAILEIINNKPVLLSHFVYSQIDTHAQTGGIIPEVAARLHVPQIIPMIEKSLQSINLDHKDIAAIAVTGGPGLVTSLLVGIHTARVLSYVWKKPIVNVNHMYGHVVSSMLSQESMNIEFPALCLTISGGHTELVLLENWYDLRIIGETRDDAVGEAFDKVGKLLGFEYPGGPKISQAALNAKNPIEFSAPMLNSPNLDFSFSGLKTAVRYYIQNLEKENKKLSPQLISDIAAGFQNTTIKVLIAKTQKALEQFSIKSLLIGGGVAANNLLREELKKLSHKHKELNIYIPELKYCTDNAAMIALAGHLLAEKEISTPYNKLKADPNWEVGTNPEQ